MFNTQKHGNRYANYLANAFIMRVLSCLYETHFLTGNSTLNDDKLKRRTKIMLNKKISRYGLLNAFQRTRFYDGTLCFFFMKMKCESPELL